MLSGIGIRSAAVRTAATLCWCAGLAIGAFPCLADPVHVSPGGSDSNPGTPGQPVRTIARAITLASGSASPVYIGQGTYSETIGLASDVSLFGGFNPGAGWTRDPSLYPSVIVGGTTAIVGDMDHNIVLDGLVIRSSNAGAGGSSTGVFLSSCQHVSMLGCRIEAGIGGAGADGPAGLPGGAGANGQLGGPGCEESSGLLCSNCARPSGGMPGTNPWGNAGGRGGDAGHAAALGTPGTAGAGPAAGAGGSGTPPHLGNWDPPLTYCGVAGAPGAAGTNGTGGLAVGGVTAAGYAPAAGQSGSLGQHGAGGGGGGGGGGGETNCDSYGGGGGGGGGGGERGGTGVGGGGGGGSFCIVLDSCDVISVRDCALVTAMGGAGGSGGGGGAGGAGGIGARVGSSNMGNPYGGTSEQEDGSNGGRGADGGHGGGGGFGGGGGGGPTIAIFNDGVGPVIVAGNGYVLGAPGAGGGGSVPGLPGVSEQIRGPSSGPVAVEGVLRLPRTIELASGTPNPFQRSTRIDYALAVAGRMMLTVHDLQGGRVATLAEGDAPAGHYSVVWDALVADGRSAHAGVYFVRLTVSGAAGSETRLRKIVMTR
jgi:hypothetical protein